jgi:hypothetical protein
VRCLTLLRVKEFLGFPSEVMCAVMVVVCAKDEVARCNRVEVGSTLVVNQTYEFSQGPVCEIVSFACVGCGEGRGEEEESA